MVNGRNGRPEILRLTSHHSRFTASNGPQIALASHAPEKHVFHQRLLSVEPVLGLVPHDALGSVDDRGVHFLTPVRGQAVHEQRIGLRNRHHLPVHAVAREILFALFGLRFGTHAGPDVGGDEIGAAGRDGMSVV